MNGVTRSQAALSSLQGRYGSADYRNWQSLRKRFYSFVDYPEAGGTQFNFFGSALGQNGVTRDETNMPKAGSFGQNMFLIKAVACVVKIGTYNLNAYDGTDASTLAWDFMNGLVQNGHFELTINSRPFVQFPKPFLYAPPFDGRTQVHTAGIQSLTLTEGTPNVLNTYVTAAPYVSQVGRHKSKYLVDPNVLIESEQAFEVTIGYPSGAIPVIGTDITNDSSNPLKVGVILDGLLFRPLQ